MWLECIRYRFRLDPEQDCLELAQEAALQSLRHSPRCKSWRVLPSPNDPSLSILEIEWDAGPSQAPFRGSEEFAALHAALTAQVRALDEADYRTDGRPARRALPSPDAIFRLAEDIVARVMRVPELAGRFHSLDGSRRARLGLWLVEVLGGPALFSSNFSGVTQGDGPLAGEPLDLDERERFLEVAQDCRPSSAAEPGSSVLGTLRANLPLYPAPPDTAAAGFGRVDGFAAHHRGGSPSDELYLGDELLVESERLLEDERPPRAYLPAPLEDTDEGSGPPTSRGLGPRSIDSGEVGSEPPSSGLETRAAPPSSPSETATPGTRDGAPRERDPNATWARRRLGRRYRAFDSGVFPQARRQTAKR